MNLREKDCSLCCLLTAAHTHTRARVRTQGKRRRTSPLPPGRLDLHCINNSAYIHTHTHTLDTKLTERPSLRSSEGGTNLLADTDASRGAGNMRKCPTGPRSCEPNKSFTRQLSLNVTAIPSFPVEPLPVSPGTSYWLRSMLNCYGICDV